MLKPGRVDTPDGPTKVGAADAATALSMSDLIVVSSPTGGKLTDELSTSGFAGLVASLSTVTDRLSLTDMESYSMGCTRAVTCSPERYQHSCA